MSRPPDGGLDTRPPAVAALTPTKEPCPAGPDVPREGSREIQKRGKVISVPYDWCKSKKKPVAYRIWCWQADAGNLANTVRQTDCRSHVQGSYVKVCYGDEPGTGGGVQSGTCQAECTLIGGSPTVRAEGRPMGRRFDKWHMNHANTWGCLQNPEDTGNYNAPKVASIDARMVPSSASMYQASSSGPGSDAGNLQTGTQQAFELPFEMPPEVAPFLEPKVGGPKLEPRVPPDLDPRLGPEPGPEPVPAPQPGPKPVPPGVRITGCRSELVCFEQGKYDQKEYRKQLKYQQDGLNKKTACQNVADIKRFDDQSPAEKAAQRGRANRYRDNTYKPSYVIQNPGVSLAGKNALHRIDMVAGGNETDFVDYGDSGVNQSIGGEWPAETRKGKLKRYVDEMCKKGCRMSVTLDICETPFDPATMA